MNILKHSKNLIWIGLIIFAAAGCVNANVNESANITINSNNAESNSATNSVGNSTPPPTNAVANTPTNSNSPTNTNSPAPKTDSGIIGTMTIGPTCGGPVRQDQPCPDKPYQGTVNIKDANGKIVTTVTADSNGKFKVVLQPGKYTVEPVVSRFPSAGSQEATVKTGSFTEVQIQYDSGLR